MRPWLCPKDDAEENGTLFAELLVAVERKLDAQS
jgi:hypothetical protein